MVRFLRLLAAEPEITRVPVMVDSSRWEVIEAGLQCLQGKGVVNSISLKDGEEAFLERALTILRYGAAVVVMAFDEEGQADTRERKVAICRRAYRLLTEEAGFPPEDIIFDPNVFAVATGIAEHDSYGEAFIEAVREIRCGAAPRAHERGHLEPLVLVPGQRRGPRGDAHRLPLPRDPGRAGHGDRERRSASRLRRDPGRAHRSDRGRPLPAPRGGDRTPDPDRGRLRGKGNGEGGGPLVAQGAGGQAAHPRPRPGNRPLDRGGRGRGRESGPAGPST